MRGVREREKGGKQTNNKNKNKKQRKKKELIIFLPDKSR
jgi:hypothetical protein